jgi:hypothetical protein
MVESVFVNSGRELHQTVGHLASRHTREIADRAAAVSARAVRRCRPTNPHRPLLAAFTVPRRGAAISARSTPIWRALRDDVTATSYRDGRGSSARPAADLPAAHRRPLPRRAAIAQERSIMFPFVTVVRQCPRRSVVVERMGPTLVCTAITAPARTAAALLETPCTSIG